MQVVTALTEPTKFFDELHAKPSFWLPLLALLLGSLVVWFMYYQRVDGAWLIEQIIIQADAKPAEATAMREHMSLGMLKWGSLIGVPFTIAAIFLISALYYKLAGKVAGVDKKFTEWFAFTCWTALPMLVSTLISLLAVFTMSAQTTPEAIQLSHLDPMLLNLPLDSAWKKFANAIDLLQLWSIGLVAIGWKQWSRGGWVQAITVAILPSLLIFGGWAIGIIVSQ